MRDTRIQKAMADMGLCSRRQAEQIILEGRVKLNGRPVKLGDKMDMASDLLSVDGQTIRPPKQKEYKYYILHKPRGYITTARDDRGRKTVMELVADIPTRVYPVGRLDKDSEGLLLFTNDGDLLHRLISPKKEVPKVYYAKHEGMATEEDVDAFLRGITLRDGTECLPARLEPLGPGESLVTVCEGKYHQVRRMMASRNMMVTYLERREEGKLGLGELPRGNVRELTEEEIASLEV